MSVNENSFISNNICYYSNDDKSMIALERIHILSLIILVTSKSTAMAHVNCLFTKVKMSR